MEQENDMARIREQTIDEAEFDTVIASDFSFEGDAYFETVLVKGALKGTIQAEKAVIIMNGAVVDAKVEAESLVLKGKLKGDLVARMKVELDSTAEMTGKIITPDLLLASGSRFNGTCKMIPAEVLKEVSSDLKK
jgi:cytoskeletal protein CcmA (bactofilin family)